MLFQEKWKFSSFHTNLLKVKGYKKISQEARTTSLLLQTLATRLTGHRHSVDGPYLNLRGTRGWPRESPSTYRYPPGHRSHQFERKPSSGLQMNLEGSSSTQHIPTCSLMLKLPYLGTQPCLPGENLGYRHYLLPLGKTGGDGHSCGVELYNLCLAWLKARRGEERGVTGYQGVNGGMGGSGFQYPGEEVFLCLKWGTKPGVQHLPRRRAVANIPGLQLRPRRATTCMLIGNRPI